MKFIEIAEGLSIRRDKIEAISKNEDNGLTSIVKTASNVYDSTFPYAVLLELLESNIEEINQAIKQEELNIFKEMGTPAW